VARTDDAGVAGRAAPGQVGAALEDGDLGAAARELERRAGADRSAADDRHVDASRGRARDGGVVVDVEHCPALCRDAAGPAMG
jgi:hypothetical protein